MRACTGNEDDWKAATKGRNLEQVSDAMIRWSKNVTRDMDMIETCTISAVLCFRRRLCTATSLSPVVVNYTPSYERMDLCFIPSTMAMALQRPCDDALMDFNG